MQRNISVKLYPEANPILILTRSVMAVFPLNKQNALELFTDLMRETTQYINSFRSSDAYMRQ